MAPVNLSKPFAMHKAIARLVDGSRFDEFKPLYGNTLITGARACARPYRPIARMRLSPLA